MLWLGILIVLIVLLVLFYEFWFLRDPERKVPSGETIVSPADGKVIKIMPFDNSEVIVEKGLAGQIKVLTNDVAQEGWIVSIFMSPLDVHVNRAPVKGEVKYVHHKAGKFSPALPFRVLFENERTEVLIVNKKMKVKVVQIAGFVARRIVTWIRPGEWVERGQRIGLIKLGSQCSLVIPKKVRLRVKEGERVYAGSSIIAD